MSFTRAFGHALEELVHLIAHADELLHGEPNQARQVALHDLLQEVPDLAVVALAAGPVDLLPEPGDALGEQALLVHRLLAMPQLRHAVEFLQDTHRLGSRGREHHRRRLVLAVHHHACVDVAQGGHLVRLLHQPLETLLVPRAPGRVVGDVPQGRLLGSPSHCRPAKG
ncbi:uncharacterized protein LOC123407516 [Hordeum vulgare subsp. vulgare]|uniref:Predicted protein n=1 Tax=Hordeum vulgare subsp. vulgare TaxID=112509 RepID=F2E9D6_HORVV|nr:uncharacterized protein LOC123407516 [Hordeum vulgare subsp. vulgare]BAK03958.1 predicted protein [Hordeum vulgare subsp. vulgare]